MQDNIFASLSWKQALLSIFTMFGGGAAVKLYSVYLNRHKPAAEVHATEAGADKTRAEARKLNAEADVQFNSIVERLHIRIDEMAKAIDEIRAERDECKLQYELQCIELKLRDGQGKRMKAILDVRGIKLSDFDEPRGE